MARRTHTSIDRLPGELREAVMRMLVDDEWPADWPGWLGKRDGKPRYEDVVAYLEAKGHSVSHSAVGRYALSVRALARMRRASDLAREIMADVTEERVGASQAAVAEMITAQVIEAAAGEELSAKELEHLAKAASAAVGIALKAEGHLQKTLAKKAEAADAKISKFAKKKKLDPETIAFIREHVYGIVK